MQTAPAGDFALFAGKSLAEASQALWGWQLRMPDGATVKLFTLRNANGMVAKVMTYGATLTELHAPDRGHGRRRGCPGCWTLLRARA